MISGRCNNVSLHKLIAERLACAILMSMSMSNLSWLARTLLDHYHTSPAHRDDYLKPPIQAYCYVVSLLC